jgi:nitrite reductase (NO-forming)
LALVAGAPMARAGDALPAENAVLTDAPNVPPPITRKHAAHVNVTLDVVETTNEIADRVLYTKWTFGGKAPGKFIRVREGDLVTFTLRNLTNNMMPHNIDLHAVTGPGGGAKVTLTAPGNESTFEWKALHAGIYVYHCATAPVPMHLSNGMYGLILVEPKAGMEPVDHEYYLMQSEWYTQRAEPEPNAARAYTGSDKPGVSRGDLYEFSFDKMLAERPDYVTWNGRVGSLTGANALQAKVGEKVRLYVGNAGLNLVSSFHIIGDHLEKCYDEGSLETPPLRNIQNHLIPAGAAAMIETVFEVPGDYPLVDHSLGRAFNKGALGIMHVDGPQQADIYKFIATRPLSDALAGKPNTPGHLTPAMRESLSTCAGCHDLSAARKHLVGPGLFGVYGRSPSINGVKFEKWDATALNTWLTNAAAVKASTMMSYRVPDPKDRARIIEALEHLK